MKKIIFNLGRNGGLPLYAKNVIENISEKDDLIFNSLFSEFKPDAMAGSRNIPTYRNKIEFILFSLTVLPVLLVYLVKLRLLDGFDKVYFPYIHFWTSPILIVCKLMRVKSYVTVHDGKLHLGDGIPLEKINLESSIKLANSLIYLSDYVKSQVEENYDVSSKEHLVSSLGTLAQASEIDFFEKKSHGCERFLFFGRVSKYKGVELMLDSFVSSPHLRDKVITVAGRSNYSIDYSRYDCLNGLNVIDRYVSEIEIQELFDSHDVLIMPYIDATQSGVLTYAIKSRTLVVMTNIGGLAEQVDSNSAYICEPNLGSLKESLEKVVSDEQTRNQVFANFCDFASKENDSKITEKLAQYLT